MAGNALAAANAAEGVVAQGVTLPRAGGAGARPTEHRHAQLKHDRLRPGVGEEEGMVCRVNFGCHLVLVEPCQSGLADRLELAHLGGERGEDGGGEDGVLLVLWVPSWF